LSDYKFRVSITVSVTPVLALASIFSKYEAIEPAVSRIIEAIEVSNGDSLFAFLFNAVDLPVANEKKSSEDRLGHDIKKAINASFRIRGDKVASFAIKNSVTKL
jgi:hypothetical protein